MAAGPVRARASDLRRCVLFEGFSDDQLDRLEGLLTERVVEPGTTIVREGEPAAELFIIRDGVVEVAKRAPGSTNEHRLTTLRAGDTFGEMTFVDRGPRSASVRAVEHTVLAFLPTERLEALGSGDHSVEAHMLRNLAGHLARRLRGTSETTVTALEHELELARTRVAMGTFLTYVVFLMVAYGFVLRIATDLVRDAADTALISIPVIVGFGGTLLVMMLRSREPVATYGLTLRGGRRAAIDAVIWTLPMLAIVTAGKWLLVSLVPALAAEPVFALGGLRDPATSAAAAWFAFMMSLAYLLIVPVQEFVARGALQAPLQRFLVGRGSTARAIVIADALFATSHLYLSPTFALIAFPPGLVWGWLYARHGTLVAPTVSHALIGWWGLFVLGFDRLMS